MCLQGYAIYDIIPAERFIKNMSKNRTLFLFAFLGMCVPLVSDAASSVRVLNPVGSANTTTAAPVRDTTGVATTRRATLPVKTKQIAPTVTTTPKTTNTANTGVSGLVDPNRLSVIKNLKLQNPVGNSASGGTTPSPSGSNNAWQEAMEALRAELETRFGGKADQATVDNINAALSDLDGSVDGLNSSVTDLADSISGINSRIDEIEDNTNAETVANHGERITALETVTSAAADSIASLDSASTEHASRIAALESTIESLSSQIAELEALLGGDDPATEFDPGILDGMASIQPVP